MRNSITKKQLEHLYIDKELSLNKISKKLKINYDYLRKVFKEFGVKKLYARDRVLLRGYKKCLTCKKNLSLDLFYNVSERPDGFDKNCIPCCKILGRKNRKNNIIKNKNRVTYEDKTCPRCKVKKPPNYFSISNKNADGLAAYCKDCSSEIGIAKYNDKVNKNKNKTPVSEKVCSKCKINKPSSEFKICYDKNSLLSSQCKLCESKYKSEFYKENRDKVLERNRLWRFKNHACKSEISKRREADKIKLDHLYTKEHEKITKDVFNNECAKCKSKENLCIDHHMPLSKGYGLSLSNAVILCKTCNCCKHTKDPKDFYSIEELGDIEKKLQKAIHIGEKTI